MRNIFLNYEFLILNFGKFQSYSSTEIDLDLELKTKN